jgi:hypothetical protein
MRWHCRTEQLLNPEARSSFSFESNCYKQKSRKAGLRLSTIPVQIGASRGRRIFFESTPETCGE